MSEPLHDDLRQAIASRQAVIVVGAGVSIAATGNQACASWLGLLHDGIDRCVGLGVLKSTLAPGLHDQVNAGDLDLLLAVAETIAAKLGAPKGGEYRRWLRESVGALELRDRDVLAALADLSVPLVTTNYDGLIERITGRPAVTWMDVSRVERVLRGDEEGILHLHGHWENPESVVLGLRSYEQVLGSEHAQNVLHSLQLMKTLVFVGCGTGLEDPNFGRLLEWSGRVLAQSEYRRFRLAQEREREELQKLHARDQRLFVVSYGVGHDELAAYLRTLAPARSSPIAPATDGALSSGPAPLPARPRCIGREQELLELVSALLSDAPRPTPILGPPGIGKSNLSLAALHDERVAARYGIRRFFVRCDGMRSHAELSAGIAGALGLPLGTQERELLAELRKAPGVLVLDNTETPWRADVLGVEELLAQLAAVPGLALVASIRGHERPAGVDWRDPIEPRQVTLAAARDIFLAIAGAQVAADPRLTDLMNVVDRLPFAVTLMAHTAQGEPDLEETWQRWQAERTAMLQRADAAHRLTNIELSYEISLTDRRVTPAARRLLSMLANLRAGLTRADVQTLLIHEAAGARSVLRKAGLAFDEAGRLRALAPLREYVRRQHPLAAADRERLGSHFLTLAIELIPQAMAPDGDDALSRLIAEAANIEAVVDMGLEAPEQALAARAAAEWVRFRNWFGMLLFENGYTRQAQPFYERALAMLERLPAADEELIANVANNLGQVEARLGGLERAKELLERAVQLREGHGAPSMALGVCLDNLGGVHAARGELDRAEAMHRRALGIFQQHRGRFDAHVATALGNLSLVYLGRGDLERAEAYRLRACDTHQRRLGVAHPETLLDLQHLAVIATERGNLEQAEAYVSLLLSLADGAPVEMHRVLAEMLASLTRTKLPDLLPALAVRLGAKCAELMAATEGSRASEATTRGSP